MNQGEAGPEQAEQRPAADRGVWHYRGYDMEVGHFATAMVHLYRAEVGRANLWRSRLDTTTNWAVVTTAAALTFAFGSPQNPHFVLLLVLLLVLTFLLIEARRYSYYAIWYYRVRLLEIGFFGTMLQSPFEPPAEWSEKLSHSLKDPVFVTPRWRAAATRYRRNYFWLVSLVVLSWLLKLTVHPVPAGAPRELIERAAIGMWVPGIWVISVVVAVYVALLVVTVLAQAIPQPGVIPQRQPSDYTQARPRGPKRGDEQMAIIITNRKRAVADRLMEDLNRGVTAIAGTGMYTGEPRDVLLIAVPSGQDEALRRIVNESDPGAFIILTSARDVRGRGFAPAEPPS